MCLLVFVHVYHWLQPVRRRSPVITDLPRVQWRHARRPAGTWPEGPWELLHSSSTFECRWPWWDGCHWKGEPLRSKLGCLNNQTCGLHPTEDAHFSASETWLATWEGNNLDLRACSIARLVKQRVMCLDQSREKPWQLQVGLSTTQQGKKRTTCLAQRNAQLQPWRNCLPNFTASSSICTASSRVGAITRKWGSPEPSIYIPISPYPISLYIYIHIYIYIYPAKASRLPHIPPVSRVSQISRAPARTCLSIRKWKAGSKKASVLSESKPAREPMTLVGCLI